MQMLIDTDGGSDDIMAIAMAIKFTEKYPKHEITSITCVDGNVSLYQAYCNVRTLLEMMNRQDIEIVCGSFNPLIRTPVRAYETHGRDGVGDLGLSNNYDDFRCDTKKAALKIAKAAKSGARIVCLGPLTNIAMACKLYPEEMYNADIWFMGTPGFGEGNVTPNVEFNMFQDPEAANIVFTSCYEIHIIGWDMCLGNALFNPEDAKMLSDSSELGKYLVQINKTLSKMNDIRFGNETLDLADPVAMAIALYPSIAQFEDCPCIVDTNPGINYGSVVMDKYRLFGIDDLVEMNFNSHKVCRFLDSRQFKKVVFDLLGGR